MCGNDSGDYACRHCGKARNTHDEDGGCGQFGSHFEPDLRKPIVDLPPKKTLAFMCSDVGIAGTTKVFLRKVGGKTVARVGIAIFGTTNRKESELRDADPFDDGFHDNYAEGVGDTLPEALDALRADVKKLAGSLWAE